MHLPLQYTLHLSYTYYYSIYIRCIPRPEVQLQGAVCVRQCAATRGQSSAGCKERGQGQCCSVV